MSRVHLECKVWIGPLGNRKPAMVLGCEVTGQETWYDECVAKSLELPADAPRTRNPCLVTCRACRRSTAMLRLRHDRWRVEQIEAMRALRIQGNRRSKRDRARTKTAAMADAREFAALVPTPVDMRRTRPARADGCTCKRCQRKAARRALQGAEGKAA